MPRIPRRTLDGLPEEAYQDSFTAQKSAVEPLPQDEKLYSTLVNSLGGIVWEADGETFQFIFVSPQAERILGYPIEQWLNEPNFWLKHTHADDADWCAAFCVDATMHRRDHQFEYRMMAADGRVIWLHDIISVISAPDGQVRLRGIMVDITERKRIEEALETRLRFETLLTELSAAFANLPAEQVEQEIEHWLRRLAELLEVDRATFFQFREDGQTIHRTHSYTVPGIEPLTPGTINERFPWMTEQLRRGQTTKWLRIPDDIPAEAAEEREYFIKVGVKSGMNIPVSIGGAVVCALAFASLRAYRDWSDAMVARLRLVGEIFANALARKHAEEANHKLVQDLAKRVKELTALHNTARILLQSEADSPIMARALSSLLPPAFKHPEVAAARIRLGGNEVATPAFTSAKSALRADFTTADEQAGSIEVIYTEERPPATEGPFLAEERALVNTLADMLRTAYDRRQAESLLRESEMRFRQLTENIREVLWMHTPDFSETLYISPAYEVVWGRTCESMYREPRSFLEAIHPEDRQRVDETIEQNRLAGFEVEYRIIRPDGSVRWIWDRGCPIKDAEGNFYRIAGLAEDITERKQAEEQYRMTSEQLRALTASLRSAREEEGVRIAREIHDELGSALTSLRWDLEEMDKTLAEAKVQSSLPAFRQKIEAMSKLIDATVNTVRRISSELRPSVLDDLGLAAALEWQAQQFEARTGIVCRYDCSLDDLELDRKQSTSLFRISQEALTNLLRHAQATRVGIMLELDVDALILSISDNGKGITEDEKRGRRSLGLLGMRERAHLIGGEVSIEGVAGKGTTVVVRVPLARPTKD